MPIASFLIVVGFICGSFFLSWFYFRHYEISRAPVGVYNLSDVGSMLVLVVLTPYLYLVLPLWCAVGLLFLATTSILYYLLEPVLHRKWLSWPVLIGLLVLDGGLSILVNTSNNFYYLVNNIVLVLTIVGLTNLWAQSGMKARDAAILGLVLAVYDLVATSILTTTSDMLQRLAGFPLAPMVVWSENRQLIGIGLGDLLLGSVFPLVIRKAFGRKAGLITLAINLLVIISILALPVPGYFPVMVMLGPLEMLQYLYWRNLYRRERSTYQYLQAEPLRAK